jgi:hypothetical protein
MQSPIDRPVGKLNPHRSSPSVAARDAYTGIRGSACLPVALRDRATGDRHPATPARGNPDAPRAALRPAPGRCPLRVTGRDDRSVALYRRYEGDLRNFLRLLSNAAQRTAVAGGPAPLTVAAIVETMVEPYRRALVRQLGDVDTGHLAVAVARGGAAVRLRVANVAAHTGSSSPRRRYSSSGCVRRACCGMTGQWGGARTTDYAPTRRSPSGSCSRRRLRVPARPAQKLEGGDPRRQPGRPTIDAGTCPGLEPRLERPGCWCVPAPHRCGSHIAPAPCMCRNRTASNKGHLRWVPLAVGP